MLRPLALVLLIGAISCTRTVVRYDPSPSPLDTGYHSLLMEACGLVGMGQVGCSFAKLTDQVLTLHIPLAGTTTLFSQECSIDIKSYHKEGGHFAYLLNQLIPAEATFCTIEVLVTWELPDGMVSSYPIRGLRGRVYLQRQPKGTETANLTWEGSPTTKGLALRKVRAHQPLPALKVQTTKPTPHGLYELYGCGHGSRLVPFIGDTFTIPDLAGPNSCVLFGFAKGAGGLNNDIVVAYDVFSANTIKLAVSGQMEINKGQLCVQTEDTVSLVIYNGQISNQLKACFPITTQPFNYLALLTVQGRAAYGLIRDGIITWLN